LLSRNFTYELSRLFYGRPIVEIAKDDDNSDRVGMLLLLIYMHCVMMNKQSI